ncbi:MAG TPA: DnaJ C-terminal domain-containing protein, partial [Novosphingobium sp.]|nr:DnaJ C-terminal domain-containing protein [Novosphingobium sp.]
DGFEGFGGQQEGVDISDLFEGLFGGRAAGGGGGGPFGGGGGGGPFGGMGGGRRAPAKGANVQYRLKVSLTDAAILAAQRITLSDGKTIDLKLPAGVEDGTQMRLSGKGEHGAGGRGDAIVVIEIAPHPFFKRDGDNLRLDLPVTLDEALGGAKVKVPTAEGAVMLNVAAGSSSGKTLRLKEKGMTRKDGTRGDQLVTLQIDLPPADSEAGAELAKRLGDWHDTRNPRAKFGV